jgi:hypothetical protein
VVMGHVENRRLSGLGSGQLKLEEWEQDHLCACEICQGVAYILLNLLNSAAPGEGAKSSDDAA